MINLLRSFVKSNFKKLRTQNWLTNFCRFDLLKMRTLEKLNFDNLALRCLPIDPEERNYVRTVSDACFSKVHPTPVDNPETIAYSVAAMSCIDLPLSELEREDFPEYFSGNKLLPGSDSAAHCYCGHQFGHFSGQLGDGAAMYLGEIVNSKDERWEIQLKGAGLTPYSRTADGRKVMRSSIREFLCSEAMHFLGIPTTRAGACITSDTEVIRDIFYDGRPIKEKCTIVLRIAPTFLRFGSFEIFKTMDPLTRRCGPSVGKKDILIQLLDYTIETFYPQIHASFEEKGEEKYAEFFKEVVLRTARLVADWQCIGFCHGVLNTDNMSIVGLTIDYGPFGFMDMFNPDHICNASDDGGRYSYIKQPEICLWNLKKLAEAIDAALPLSTSMYLLESFQPEFDSYYLRKMRQKLGLMKEHAEDSELIQAFLDTMESTGSDFTNSFRCLSSLDLPCLATHEISLQRLKENLVKQCYPLESLVKSLRNGMNSRNVQMLLLLSKTNPEFAEQLATSSLNLAKVVSKMEKAEKFEEMTQNEKKLNDFQLWNKWLCDYIVRLHKEKEDNAGMNALREIQARRVKMMNSVNPRFVLRNYVAQNTISKAEAGNYSIVRSVLKLLENPYDDQSGVDYLSHESSSKAMDENTQAGSSKNTQTEYTKEIIETLAPDWALGLRVT